MKKIKWVGISGSWRATSPQIETKVREVAREILLRGDGIVTGGALNVDFQATDEALKLGRESQVKIFLPATFSIYAAHYRKRAKEGVITEKQAEDLIDQLIVFKKKNPKGLSENRKNKVVDKETYYQRNSAVIEVSDELIAFQVNKSAGVQDTIDKARAKGIPVKVFSWDVVD